MFLLAALALVGGLYLGSRIELESDMLALIPEGNPHAGQFLMAEITRGGIRRVQFEEVDGTWQGAVFVPFAR